ncbi:hypothetical protein JCM10449v2_006298 [Rhodotorula kratochvilovae]
MSLAPPKDTPLPLATGEDAASSSSSPTPPSNPPAPTQLDTRDPETMPIDSSNDSAPAQAAPARPALLERLASDDPLAKPSPVPDVDDPQPTWGTPLPFQHHTSFPPAPLETPLPSSSSSAYLTTPHLASSSTSPSPSPLSSASPMRRTPSQGSAAIGAKIWGVALVGFDHALGPTIEFTHPESLKDNAELQRNLPFLALPDGAHARDEDYSYFHLLLPSVAPAQTIFGISCNRQIPADQLLNKGKDVTRSTVQKAIVVLASKPIFGALRDKLGVVTRSFFAQRNFDDKAILVDLFRSFDPALALSLEKGKGRAEDDDAEEEQEEQPAQAPEPPLSPPPEEKQRAAEEDGGMYMGTSLRELVHRFRFKTLMLLKLVMLQRRVMFFAASSPVEQLCTFQYSLVTLIPALLTALDDAASPALGERARRMTKPSSLKTSDKYSLIRYLGLPLDVFGKGSFFQPYLPLQQIDLLKTRSYLVGTTNSIFQQQRDCHIDVIVNIDSASLEILNPKLTPLITLTAADRKWMDELVTTVDASWNAADPARPLGQGFVGSDDFLRAKFEEYVCSLLACVKFGEFLGRERGERAEMLLKLESYNPASFNEAFINAFKRTAAFELWDRTTDEVIFDLVEPKHPMEGKTNPIEDVGIRLVHGLHDLSSDLSPSLAPLPQKARERLSKGWVQGRDGVWGAVEAIREDWGKRQAAAAAAGEGAVGAPGGEDKSAEGGAPPLTPSQIGGTFFAGVDVARSGAQQLAAGLGGFLGGAARKTSLFGGGGAAAGEAMDPPAPAPPTAPTLSPASAAAATPAAGGTGRFLRPLSTAAAATVPTSPVLGGGGGAPSSPLAPPAASSSASPSAPVPSPAPGGGFAGFFGGLRRIANPAVANAAGASAATTPSTPGTPAGFGTPPPLSFLSVGGWGGRVASGSAAASAATSASSLPLRLPEEKLERARTAREVAGDLGADADAEEDEEQVRRSVEEVLSADGVRAHDLDAEAEEVDAAGVRAAREEARRRLEGECGIAFAIRSSTSYRASGPTALPSDAGSSPGSTGSVGSPVSLADVDEGMNTDDPAYGIPLADGSRPEKFLDANETWEGVVQAVRSRGPDASNSLITHVRTSKMFHFEMRFHASVLHMRGDALTLQPFVADNGDVFLWNGEIFDGLEVSPHENDGQKLFEQIQECGPSNFFAAIRDIEGPYAFVYYQASTQRVYFARDPLGRRSLLFHPPTPASPYLFLASNSPGAGFPLQDWEEVACDGVHCYHLNDLKGKSWLVDGRRGLSSYPRYPKSLGLSQDILVYPFDPLVTSLPQPGSLTPSSPANPAEPVITSQLALAIQSFISELERAIRARVATVPSVPAPPDARIAILFSGGLDCTVLAVVLDRVLPDGEAVDLINVAFENPRKLKAKQAANGKGKEKAVIVADAMDVDEMPPPDPPVTSKVYDVPDRLTARDSWEELKRLRPQRKWNLVEVNVPYREMLEHRQTVIDLMKPQRTVMDLSISIAFWFAARGKGHLSQFATSRTSSSPPLPAPIPYHSHARVLLSGLGADEQLGGYARHRKAFAQPASPTPASSTTTRPSASVTSPTISSTALPPVSSSAPSASSPAPPQNWSALLTELQLDLDRLPTRNLGRDDRILSSHGKEARYPYLAGHVVAFLARQPVWLKTDYRFPEGTGDKMLLRLVARRLGLAKAASLPKKAAHFGSGTAKMELTAGRAKGTDLLE